MRLIRVIDNPKNIPKSQLIRLLKNENRDNSVRINREFDSNKMDESDST
jgi:hypothetical protein